MSAEKSRAETEIWGDGLMGGAEEWCCDGLRWYWTQHHLRGLIAGAQQSIGLIAPLTGSLSEPAASTATEMLALLDAAVPLARRLKLEVIESHQCFTPPREVI